MMMPRIVTAAVMLIGDELLSGRTQDTNLKSIADFLAPLGVEIREARMIPDVRTTIVDTVRHLAKTYDYVFTTGGIGPTHDDITADCIAEAFDRHIDVREDAVAIMRVFYAGRNVNLDDKANSARLRMARIPDGAELILNPVSGAPGFRLHNVFVMAGIPSVMRGMLEDLVDKIEGGAVVHSHTVRGAGMREGDIAKPFGELAKASPQVSFGSYPWMRPGGKNGPDYGVNLVVRGRDPDMLASALNAVIEIVRAQGVTPEIDPKEKS